jgi:hypothetical protein
MRLRTPIICLVAGLVAILAGCKGSGGTDTPATKTTPVLVDNAAKAVGRADTKLAAAQPKVTDPEAKTNVAGARADIAEAKDDLSGAAKQAAADAKDSKAKDVKITTLEQADPFRTAIRWAAIILTVGGLVLVGSAALYLRNPNLGMLAGYISVCGIGLGLLEHLLPTLEAILKWGLIGLAVALAAAVAWLYWQWGKTHKIATTIVSSIEAAKASAGLQINAAAAAVLSGVQSVTTGTKALVDKVQGK